MLRPVRGNMLQKIVSLADQVLFVFGRRDLCLSDSMYVRTRQINVVYVTYSDANYMLISCLHLLNHGCAQIS